MSNSLLDGNKLLNIKLSDFKLPNFKLEDWQKYITPDNVLIAVLAIYIIAFSYRIPPEISFLLKQRVFKIIMVIAIIFLCYYNNIAAILLTIAYILTINIDKNTNNIVSITERFQNGDDDDSDNDDDIDETNDKGDDTDTDADSDSDSDSDDDDESEEPDNLGDDDEEDYDGDEDLETYRIDNPELTDNFKKLHDTLHKYQSFLKKK